MSRGSRFAPAAFALAVLVGCGPAIKTFPVQGKVTFADGDLKKLAGQSVEIAKDDDTTVRAYGTINEDGTFALTTLYNGQSLPGAPAGMYKARLVIEDVDPVEDEDEAPSKPLKPSPIHRRYLKFETAKLSVEVPAAGEVVLKVSKK